MENGLQIGRRKNHVRSSDLKPSGVDGVKDESDEATSEVTYRQPDARKQIAADSVDAVEWAHNISCTVDLGHCSGARYERAAKHRSRHRAL
jgi:hypothetical protein